MYDGNCVMIPFIFMEAVTGSWRRFADLVKETASQDNLLGSRQITEACSAIILMMVGFLQGFRIQLECQPVTFQVGSLWDGRSSSKKVSFKPVWHLTRVHWLKRKTEGAQRTVHVKVFFSLYEKILKKFLYYYASYKSKNINRQSGGSKCRKNTKTPDIHVCCFIHFD